ncbi:MAG: hypothetical protein HY822_01645 [Acidobacteria bacterium]|nr:hypothetical protein [Acidobacteriota bacterium]
MATRNAERNTASVQVNVYDGTRELLAKKMPVLYTIFDGFKKQILRDFKKSPSVTFRVPFYDNLGDNYTFLAHAGGYAQTGLFPIQVSAGVTEQADLMLLPKEAGFDFRAARWDALKDSHPGWLPLLQRGAANEAAARDRYTQVMERRPESLAALLNILTALSPISLPAGTPLDYFKELLWDDTMQRDRFFGYADPALLDQVRRAAKQGAFQQELGSALFHPGATESYKQVQFGEANVQLTFHEGETKKIGGVDCVKVEPDIDYFKDLAAHIFLEVVVNGITGSLTDPKQVYVLRWMAGRHAGVPAFDPPYTIV